MKSETFARLRDVLAYLYPDEASIRRIANDADIGSLNIPLGPNARNTWHSILDEAKKAGLDNALLDVVLSDGYRGNRELLEAAVAYRGETQERTDYNVIYEQFPISYFRQCLSYGSTISILNTWIPNLDQIVEDLIIAIKNHAHVRLLLLYPKSLLAEARNEALKMLSTPVPPDSVEKEIYRNLELLEFVSRSIGSELQSKIQVKVYNSLPSVSIYQVDDVCLVGFYLHGRLAINSSQLQISSQSKMGHQISREFDILWEIGEEINDLENWRTELDTIRGEF